MQESYVKLKKQRPSPSTYAGAEVKPRMVPTAQEYKRPYMLVLTQTSTGAY